MNNGKPTTIVDMKTYRRNSKNDPWLTIIDFKSCLVIFANSEDEKRKSKKKIKVFSCYAA